MSEVNVVIGAGSIGQAIARRVSAGKHVLLADPCQSNAAGVSPSQAWPAAILAVDLCRRLLAVRAPSGRPDRRARRRAGDDAGRRVVGVATRCG